MYVCMHVIYIYKYQKALVCAYGGPRVTSGGILDCFWDFPGSIFQSGSAGRRQFHLAFLHKIWDPNSGPSARQS